MRMFLPVVLVSGLLLGCGSDPEPAVADDADDADASTSLGLRFGWGPGRLAVTEKVYEKGRDREKSYLLEVATIDEGLSITYRDFQITSISGLDLQDPALRAEKDKLEAQLAATPPVGFRVSSAGTFLGLLDQEAILRQVEAVQGAREAAKVRALLSNPQWREMAEQSAAIPWRAWVEVWLGIDVEPGEVVEGDFEIEFAGGQLVQHVRVEHLGPDSARPGHVRVRYESRIDDPRYWSLLVDLAANTVAEPQPEKVDKMREVAQQGAEQLDFLHERVIEVSLDPHDMVPAWAKYQMRTQIRGREPGLLAEDIDTLEIREWSFASAGLGCVRMWPPSGCATVGARR